MRKIKNEMGDVIRFSERKEEIEELRRRESAALKAYLDESRPAWKAYFDARAAREAAEKKQKES